MNIVKLKSMSLGILKIVSFVVLIFLIERILFLTHGVIPSSFWQKFDGRGLNEPLFFYSILMNLLSAFLICYIFLKYIEKKGFAFIRFSFQDMTKRFFVGALISS